MSIQPDEPEQKRVADAASGQRAQFQLLVETVEDYAIFLLDPAGHVASWNPGAERFKGYRADEIIGKHFSVFYTEEDRRAGKPEWELEVAAREGRIDDEGWRVRKDGSLFWADDVVTAIRDETGKLLGFGKVTRDLTARREAEQTARRLAQEEARRQEAESYGARMELLRRQLEQALQAQQEATQATESQRAFFDTLVRRLPVGVATADTSLCYVQMNDRAEDLLGGNLIGRKIAEHDWYEGFHPDGTQYAAEDWPLWRAIRHGETVLNEEVRIIYQDGRQAVFSISASPLLDGSGTIRTAVAAIEDISELKRAQELAELQARFREHFMGVLGHDLRTPLASIKMGSQLLLRRGPEPEVAKTVGRIAASAERMERMISDLLDLTRSRLGGGLSVNRQPADLAALCQLVVEEVQVAHPTRGLALQVEGETHGAWDTSRVMQLLSNLLENAIAYGSKEGQVELLVCDLGAAVRLSVHNEGEPIPEAVRPRLFEPYRGADEQRRPGASKGLGLGLFIAKQIALAHGGDIQFESTREGGTTFHVLLPKEAP